ncbi:hypothetical protein D3C73_1487670 [compost metagenome]
MEPVATPLLEMVDVTSGTNVTVTVWLPPSIGNTICCTVDSVNLVLSNLVLMVKEP